MISLMCEILKSQSLTEENVVTAGKLKGERLKGKESVDQKA